MNVLMVDAGGAKATTQPAATVLNPTILVDGVATEQISLYESQASKVVVTVQDPTNNNAALSGWVVLRTDNHQNLVNDNLATNGAPPTDANGQTTVTLTAGKVTDKQNPVSVTFTAKSPNFRQPNNPNVATVNVAVKAVRWTVTTDHWADPINKGATAKLSTKGGAGGDTATATVAAIDAQTGKAVTGVSLTVTDALSDSKYATLNGPTTKTTDPNTGTVQFSLTSNAGKVGLRSGIFTWTFADATGADLTNNSSGQEISQDVIVTVSD